jgi:hypothetical protein
MSDFNYSVVLRDLANDYFSQRITREEYRDKRTQILDKIDAEYNGRKMSSAESRSNAMVDDSFFMKTVAFFKNKNVDQ